MTHPQQQTVRLYKFNRNTGRYTLEEEYESMEAACKGNNCITGVVEKNCKKKKDELSRARKHTRSAFFKTHVFRLSQEDDLER